MIKTVTLEIWVDENLEDARECIVEVIKSAREHYLCLDGSVEIKIADVELE